MTDHDPLATLHNLREGSDEFQRALTRLEGVTEEDAFETLTTEEIRALEKQLTEEQEEPDSNEMLERVTEAPSAVIHHAHIETPETRDENESTDTTE